MKIPNFRSCLLAVTFVAGFLFTITKTTLGDTYQTFRLPAEGEAEFYGMDDSGNVAFALMTGNPFGPKYCETNTCYWTFHDGTFTGFDLPSPGLVAIDNGTPCTPAVPLGGRVFRGVCNNGREAFTGTISSTQLEPHVYVGSYPDITQVTGGGGGLMFMNARGDIVYDDEFSEYWYFLLDETTSTIPEPGSIVLLGTGALGVLSLIRRRLCR